MTRHQGLRPTPDAPQKASPRLLRVLLLEDDEADAELILRELRRPNAELEVGRIASAPALREALQSPWDLIICDYSIPGFGAPSALSILKESGKDIPFIIVSGSVPEEQAVEAMRAGAHDFLPKGRLVRLLPAVEREVRDAADREAAREMARRAQVSERLAAIGTLTAGLSHEIRNPLNAAALQLRLLERRVAKLSEETQAPLLEPIAIVQHEIGRLEAILREFLQFARHRAFTPQRVVIRDVVQRALALLAEQANAAEIDLALELDGDPIVRGDVASLERAVLNLVLNAIQSTPRGGRVLVHVESRNGYVDIAVNDSGAGVPRELRERILEPFFTTRDEGTGLGLPLVHSVVEEHNGSLEVGESSLGGAKFVIRLPGSS